MIRRIMHLSDRGTVKAIQEGPYLQYFLGMPKYIDEPPFDPSLMSTFRKRFNLDEMGKITDLVIEYEKKTAMQKGNDISESENSQLKEPNGSFDFGNVYTLKLIDLSGFERIFHVVPIWGLSVFLIVCITFLRSVSTLHNLM